MSDEYIKKDDAIEAFREEWERIMPDSDRYLIKRSFIAQALKTIPPADVVERKHGKWINVRQEGVCSWTGECSCCRDRNDIPPPILAHFCPNCGAVMRGEQ